MITNGNGAREKVLNMLPPFDPEDVNAILVERTRVLLSHATSEEERQAITDQLCRWEAPPAATRLLKRISLRVTDPEDREILRLARGFGRLLPEPPRDPQLEQLILETSARKVQVEAVAASKLDALTATYVALRKAQPAELDRLQVQLRAAVADHEWAVRAVDREISQLADLLQLRADRKRAALLEQSSKE